MRKDRGFTLIELLVVMAILGVLAAATVIVINPVELLAQSRDAARISDMDALSKSITLYQTQNPGNMPGSTSTVYLSLADTSSTCGSWSLPALPSGWSYGCSANPKMTDGTGWIPGINFGSLSANSISSLPVDPVNTASSGLYYTYTVSGAYFEVTSLMESAKYKLKQETNPTLQFYPGVLAAGTSLSISPLFNPSGLVGYWNFDDGSGNTAKDTSGNNDNGTWQGTLGNQWVTGKIGPYAGCFNGSTNYMTINDSSAFAVGNGSMSMSLWVKTLGPSGDIFTKGNASFSTGWYLTLLSRSLDNQINDGSHTVTANAPAGFLDGNWHLISLVLDRTANKLYYYEDGIAKASGDASLIGNITNTYSLKIGFNGDWAYLNGNVDDVRVYNRALSAAEVMSLYNSAK